ncbi:MAG: hypothetical protein NUV51_09380 [Sulfuricaulis sp.]|nr:hypothetical protein [Sulfuricaulis sp.]
MIGYTLPLAPDHAARLLLRACLLARAVPNVRALGGPGSGNFGHAGRPGSVGGSASGGFKPFSGKNARRLIQLAKDGPITEAREDIFEARPGHVYRGYNFAEDQAISFLEEGKLGRVGTYGSMTYFSTDPGLATTYAGGGGKVGILFEVDAGGLEFDSHDNVTIKSTGANVDFSRVTRMAILHASSESSMWGSHSTIVVVPEGEGFKALGGPGSGFFGHAGRPGEVGGSTSSRWTSDAGGFLSTGGVRVTAFHGTSDPDLTVADLDPGLAIEVEGATFFTTDKDAAWQYTSQREYGEMVGESSENVLKAQFRMTNPMIVDMDGEVGEAIKLGRLVREAKEKGHDGLILENIDDTVDSSGGRNSTHVTIAVFEKGQAVSGEGQLSLLAGVRMLGAAHPWHAGRPGKVGGSTSGGFVGSENVPGGSAAVAALPSEAAALLRASGTTFEAMEGDRSGVFDYLSNVVYVAQGAPKGVVAHEIGHAIDNRLVGGGKPGAWFWSEDAKFQAAVKTDLKAARRGSGRTKEYAQMLRGSYQNSQFGTEAFADLFAAHRMGIPPRGGAWTVADISAALPTAGKIVKGLKIGT